MLEPKFCGRNPLKIQIITCVSFTSSLLLFIFLSSWPPSYRCLPSSCNDRGCFWSPPMNDAWSALRVPSGPKRMLKMLPTMSPWSWKMPSQNVENSSCLLKIKQHVDQLIDRSLIGPWIVWNRLYKQKMLPKSYNPLRDMNTLKVSGKPTEYTNIFSVFKKRK